MQRPKFLGISMVTRLSRRILVLSAYLFLFVFPLFLFAWTNWNFPLRRPESGHVLYFYLPFVMISTMFCRGTFGKLAQQITFPELPESSAMSFVPVVRLMKKGAWANPDERQQAVRNRAYRYAFGFMGIYSFFLWLMYTFLTSFSFWVPSWSQTWLFNMVGLLLWPLLIMAASLPQAIILWTEPNLPAADNQRALASALTR